MDPRAAKYRAELEAIRANADPVAFAICQRWHGEKFAVPGHGATSFVRGQLSAAEVAVAVVLERLAGAEGAEVARLTAERDRYRDWAATCACEQGRRHPVESGAYPRRKND
uniref:Uncharacterized protein n=1 Tax=viral metagenome TaxID=1070528 RepID=A0A6H1ZFB9_9ZZZZ